MRTHPRRRPKAGPDALQPRWPDRLITAVRARRRGGRRARLIRRIAAALLLAAAAALAVVRPEPIDPGAPALAVTRDLPAGAVLAAGDLRLIHLPRLPDGAITDPAAARGRTLASAIRRGEVVTDARIVPDDGPDPGPGRVAVPIPLADTAATALLRPGTHVTVLAVDDRGRPRRVADDAVVLSVPPEIDGSGSFGSTDSQLRLAVLAVPEPQADRLAAAALTGDIAIRFS